MDYHLILNPFAGRGYAKKIAASLFRYAQELFDQVHLHLTEYPGHGKEIAAELKNNPDVIIAAGGDGTVHEVVNGIMGGKAILGVLPLGSGNDFVKMLNLPLDYKRSLEVILKGNTMPVDVGKVEDTYFANGLGIGFDAEAVIESLKVKYLRGFLIYLYAVIRTLIHYTNKTIKIYYQDLEDIKEIFMVTIGNGVALGGGFYLTPEAKIDDGELDVCIIHGLTKKEALLNLPNAMKGKHYEMPQVQFLKIREMIVEAPEGMPVHADGELIGENLRKINVKVLPKALKVIHNLDENR